MPQRRHVRALALQALYEIDSSAHPANDVIARYVDENSLANEPARFFTTLVSGVADDTVSLDRMIYEHAPEWPVDQLAVVDRNILRIAIFELLASPETPVKVAINEAVELAKIYASDSAPRFVNGVLGAIALAHAERIAAAHQGQRGPSPAP